MLLEEFAVVVTEQYLKPTLELIGAAIRTWSVGSKRRRRSGARMSRGCSLHDQGGGAVMFTHQLEIQRTGS